MYVTVLEVDAIVDEVVKWLIRSGAEPLGLITLQKLKNKHIKNGAN
jgi:hypothetical protein